MSFSAPRSSSRSCDRLAELGAGVLAGPAHGGLPGPLGHEGALGQHRALEAADPVDRDAGHLRDLLGGGTGAYPRLDVAGPQMALDLDLDLAEPGAVVAHGGAQPLVDRKRVLRAVGSLEHQSCAVVADGHDTQFGHGYLPGGACRRHVRRCFRWTSVACPGAACHNLAELPRRVGPALVTRRYGTVVDWPPTVTNCGTPGRVPSGSPPVRPGDRTGDREPGFATVLHSGHRGWLPRRRISRGGRELSDATHICAMCAPGKTDVWL